MKRITLAYLFAILLSVLLFSYSCDKIDPVPVTKFMQLNQPDNISYNSATISDMYLDVGDGIIEYGHCWSTNASPSIDDFKTSFSGSPERQKSFSSGMNDLLSNTKYFVRAYYKTDSNVNYGNEISFTTHIGLHVTTNSPILAITETTALCGGTITDELGITINNKGVCWSISPNPTISDDKTDNGSGVGDYTSNISGLTAYTKYYVRAYVSSTDYTWYGQEISFTTNGSVSDVEENTYATITLGWQTWMKENLRTTKYNDNTDIDFPGSINTDWQNNTTGAYAWYQDNAALKDELGALYNWYAVQTYKLCPAGWHVPDDNDWTNLEVFLQKGGYNFDGTIDSDNDRSTNNKIAKAMAFDQLWISSGTTGAVGNTDYQSYRNRSGFSAIPGGYRESDGLYYNQASDAYWWSSTQAPSSTAKSRSISSGAVFVNSSEANVNRGFSVRCIKD